MEQTNHHQIHLQIGETANGYLAETAKWARFLSIIGFTFCGLMLTLGLFMGKAMNGLFARPASMPGSDIFFSVVFIAVAFLYFMPCLYLYRFSKKMQTALNRSDTKQFHEALKNLKACFKFIGILTIVLLSFYALAIAVASVVAAFTK